MVTFLWWSPQGCQGRRIALFWLFVEHAVATWHILMNKVSQTWHMDKNKLHEACNGLMTYNRTWFCKRIVLYLHISTLMECIIRSQTKNKAFSHEETPKPSSSKAFPFFYLSSMVNGNVVREENLTNQNEPYKEEETNPTGVFKLPPLHLRFSFLFYSKERS